MKKATVILSGFCVVLLAVTSVIGVQYASLRKQAEDISILYVEPVNQLLEVIDSDVMLEPYRDGGVLYLDISKVTQTPCDYLFRQMEVYAEREGFTLETCSREEAVAKGLIQLADEDAGTTQKPLNCVWMILSDNAVSRTEIEAGVCLYGGGRTVYFHDMTWEKTENGWMVTELGGGMA